MSARGPPPGHTVSKSTIEGVPVWSFVTTCVVSSVCAILLLALIIYCIGRHCCRKHERRGTLCSCCGSPTVGAAPLASHLGPLPCQGNRLAAWVPTPECVHSQQQQQQQLRPAGRLGLHYSCERNCVSLGPFVVNPDHQRFCCVANRIESRTENPNLALGEGAESLQISSFSDRCPPPAGLRDLFTESDRSLRMTVGTKLVVSITRLVDYRGELLILDNMGISLRVPPAAIDVGCKQLVSLVLNWDLSDNPEMTDDQALVSPVVYCGPHGLRLNKPCTLSYKHCAFSAKDVRILSSETDLNDPKDWLTFGGKDSPSRACDVLQDECQLQITTFTLFTSILVAEEPSLGRKWIQLAVFSYPLYPGIGHHQVRVYFLNKTPCALQWAIQNEAQFGGILCCPEKVFLFEVSGQDMLLQIQYISRDWEKVDSWDFERIPFLYIWHGKCPHASICFKHSTGTMTSKELNLQLYACQEKQESCGEKMVIQTLADESASPQSTSLVCSKHCDSRITINVPKDIPISMKLNTPQNILALRNTLQSSIIPQKLKQNLRLLLDPPHIFDKNWKNLASALGHDTCIPYLCTRDSPTEELLKIVEQKQISLQQLKVIMMNLDRLDAVNEVEKFLGSGVVKDLEPAENSCQR